MSNIYETVKKAELGSTAWIAAWVYVANTQDDNFWTLTRLTSRGTKELYEFLEDNAYGPNGVTKLGLLCRAIADGYARLAKSKGPHEPVFEKVLAKDDGLTLHVHGKKIPWASRPRMFADLAPPDRREAYSAIAVDFHKLTHRLFKRAADLGGCRDLPQPYGTLRSTLSADKLRVLQSVKPVVKKPSKKQVSKSVRGAA